MRNRSKSPGDLSLPPDHGHAGPRSRVVKKKPMDAGLRRGRLRRHDGWGQESGDFHRTWKVDGPNKNPKIRHVPRIASFEPGLKVRRQRTLPDYEFDVRPVDSGEVFRRNAGNQPGARFGDRIRSSGGPGFRPSS